MKMGNMLSGIILCELFGFGYTLNNFKNIFAYKFKMINLNFDILINYHYSIRVFCRCDGIFCE